jgi:sulfur carrier protein ThiS
MDGVGTITLDINSGSSIMDIKMALHDKIGIPPKKIVLAFNGEILQSDTLLTEVRDSYPDNPLAEENKLTLLNYTKGGGKYKKRKTKKRKKKSRRKSKKRKSKKRKSRR